MTSWGVGGAGVRADLIAAPFARGRASLSRHRPERSNSLATLAEPTIAMRFAEELLSISASPSAIRRSFATCPWNGYARLRSRSANAGPSGGDRSLSDSSRSSTRAPCRRNFAAHAFIEGRGARVPLVIGTTRQIESDGAPDAERRRADSGRRRGARGARVPRASRSHRANFQGLPSVAEGKQAAASRSRASPGAPGDCRFRIPSIRFAEAHAARGLPTYAYLFTYCSPALRGVLGACHALELPFVFGTLDAPLRIASRARERTSGRFRRR